LHGSPLQTQKSKTNDENPAQQLPGLWFSRRRALPSHVSEQFGDDYFIGGGTSGYDDYLTRKLIVQAHGERYAELMTEHVGPGQQSADKKLLDIGCAAGFIMEGFRSSGWSTTGLEPNQTMVRHAELSNLRAYQGTLEKIFDPTCELPATEQFDLVSLIQVVAHLTDVNLAAQNLNQLVRPDGFVLIETWDTKSLTARILGRRWHEYSPPNVLHYFSTNSLDWVMMQAGFSFVDGGRPKKRITMGHGRSIFRYKYGHRLLGKACLLASQVLPDDFTIPYPSEDLFWRLYQKGHHASPD